MPIENAEGKGCSVKGLNREPAERGVCHHSNPMKRCGVLAEGEIAIKQPTDLAVPLGGAAFFLKVVPYSKLDYRQAKRGGVHYLNRLAASA